MNISFIGYGNMAKAIARGLLTQKGQFTISAAAPSLTTGINQEGINTFHDNVAAIKNAQVIILAVKPTKMGAVIREITPSLPSNCVLISVASGLSLRWFTNYCPKEQAIIRTMPNTPAAIRLSATPMIANDTTDSLHKEWAELIFSSIGLVSWTKDEATMDTLTALSGSGPAYLFLFLESLIDAGVKLGLNEATAKSFALQTVKGAIQLAEQSETSLGELRKRVTSPGGTTEAALAILEGHLQELMFKAMQAGKLRTFELGQIN